MLSLYSKSISFIIAAALTTLIATNTADGVSGPELVNIVITIVTAVGVYLVPNLATGIMSYAKGGVAFLGAALTVLASAITDGIISGGEWAQIALAALGAIGVVIVPNVISSKAIGKV